MSQKMMSQKTMSRKTMPRKIMPHKTMPRKIMPHKTMPHGEDNFTYQNKQLHVEQLNICNMLAQQVKTPFYLYSCAAITDQFRLLEQAISVLPRSKLFYAVKANSNVNIISHLAKLGAGFDVVSSGEILRVLKVNPRGSEIIFSGVGKSSSEIDMALNADVFCFNVESVAELDILQQRASSCNKIANISIRLNPDIDAHSNEKISTGRMQDKFGVDAKTSMQLYKSHKDYPNINFCGIAIHIGSQITDTSTFERSYSFIRNFAKEVIACGVSLDHLDVGGGFGVEHLQDPNEPQRCLDNNLAKERFLSDLSLALRKNFSDFAGTIFLEPGRFIVANAGILVTQILYVKQLEKKNHIIVDVAMNDFLRPTLYGEHHNILPIELADSKTTLKADIVGPICESGDFLGKDIYLQNISPSKHLAIFSAGAYGAVLSSMYNSRDLIGEYIVDGASFSCIRRPYTVEQQIKNEIIIR